MKGPFLCVLLKDVFIYLKVAHSVGLGLQNSLVCMRDGGGNRTDLGEGCLLITMIIGATRAKTSAILKLQPS